MERDEGSRGARRSVRGLTTTVAALGVVFGDIGTSPLYAFREALLAGDLAPEPVAVLGLASVMVWAMVVVVTLKYLVIVLRADNDGEGGILALTALIRHLLPARSVLVLVGLFGTALLYGDGVITPAISVLSAVEGVQLALPSIGDLSVPLAVLILLGLFSVQRAGTSGIGRVFGPIMAVWFATIATLGVAQIVDRPEVIRAIDPRRAVELFVSHPRSAFLALGGVFLVVTGAEALYADMGHFGRAPIRRGWFVLVFPALTLNYLGQAALLVADPQAIDNPFYRSAPAALLVPLIVLATGATVIASQALITGSFSLTMQAVQLGYLPRLRIDHTSPREKGQVYVPAVNWALMVACIVVVIGFGSSSRLAAAYGVAVTSTMVITTILLAVLARGTWGWSAGRTAVVLGLFGLVDVAFFAANVPKIPTGGWLPLLIGVVLVTIMIVWRTGRARIEAAIGSRTPLPVERFIGSLAEHPQARVRGTAVYLARQPGMVPTALVVNLRHNEVLHDTIILCHVSTQNQARVPRPRRVTHHELGEGFSQVVVHVGFMETPDVVGSLATVTSPDFGFDPSDAVYLVSRETIVGARRIVDRCFAVLHRNSTTAAQFFGLPPEHVLEVGVQVPLERHQKVPIQW